MNAIRQTKILYPEIFWERPVHYFKHNAGKVLLIAGAKGKTEQATITAESVFRTGNGILVLGFPDRLKENYKGLLPEAMALPLASTLSDSISIKAKHTIIEESKSSTVVGIGPGISRNAETGQLVWELLPNLENKIIILVGAAIDSIILGLELINQKAEPSYAKDWFANNDHLLVLLLSRSQAMKLYSKVVASTEDIPFEEMASVITEQLSCFCVITSDQTIITAKDKLFLDYNNNFPKDVLAGDILNVLFGNLCSILAQNPNKPEEAILSAVYLFNKATSTAHSEIKNRALAPSDIIRFIPPTIKEIEKNFE